MRIFLTGATGYIGSAVLDALMRGGHDVTALVRDNEKARARRARAARVRSSATSPIPSRFAAPPMRRTATCTPRSTTRPAAARRSSRSRSRPSSRRPSGRAPPASTAPAKRFVIYTSGVWVLGSAARAGRRRRAGQSDRDVVVPPRARAAGARCRDGSSAHGRGAAGRRLRRRQRHGRRYVQVGDQRPGPRRRRRQQSLAARLRSRSGGSVRAAGRQRRRVGYLPRQR